MHIVLASSSPYRRSLLHRLRLPFTTAAPDIDETALPGEPPEELAARLALAKAQRIAEVHPNAVVIGSDQAAAADGRLLTKPGTHEAAVAQLTYCSGRSAVFHTGLAVVCKNRDLTEVRVVDVEVKFRALDSQQIERYLTTEQPYDCAGSFKVEGLGISLFEAVRSDDPTSLEGLPLIALTSLLKKTDIEIP